MLRIRLEPEIKATLARIRLNKPVIETKRNVPVSVKKVALILRIDEQIVKNFFITTPDHKKYDFQQESVQELFKRTNDQIFFDEEKLLIWFSVNYLGMRELYWSRKQQWLAARRAQ